MSEDSSHFVDLFITDQFRPAPLRHCQALTVQAARASVARDDPARGTLRALRPSSAGL